MNTKGAANMSQIAKAAHEFAAGYIARFGVPKCGAAYLAECSADQKDLTGMARTIWIERVIGHIINWECTGKGV